MAGRVVTAASTARKVEGVRIARILGHTITRVEAKGKHLLVTFERPENPPYPTTDVETSEANCANEDHEAEGASPGAFVLQTHMLMTGSWHLYQAGVPWKRPARQATIVIEAGDRVAVGFNVPVVRLETVNHLRTERSLSRLGPDILASNFDLAEVLQRLSNQPVDRAIGEVLLDQRIVAGIGNIYRCEALFAQRLHPWRTLGGVAEVERSSLLQVARDLMRANLNVDVGRDFGNRPNESFVYRRAGRPCRCCGAAVQSKLLGAQARRAYWCPACQVE